MRRLWANTLFMLAIGVAGILKTVDIPQNISTLAIVSVVVSAVITNVMWIKSTGLLGVGGLSLAYSQSGGLSQAASFLIILIAILVIGAVVLMIFSDFPIPSKRSDSDEIPKL
ncbi:hypothetical protein LARV_00955 [Longilinea arvoryzae]|uniref:Uncharacterized protein n=1 Tax=Longilinea arvoryzae TaxID=360412 RepID=A0A0S7BEB0_9CHLR|nr:hypothetical protein [Longilinea arvoryzae]GAP13204.1 hypothetical protein LARV_00955 [Longilinea arvoryzae]